MNIKLVFLLCFSVFSVVISADQSFPTPDNQEGMTPHLSGIFLKLEGSQ